MENKILVKDTFKDYLGAKDYLSSSDISQLLKSQKHFEAYHSGKITFEETTSQKIGTAVHCAILEPNEFDNLYVVFLKLFLPFPNSTMAKKENKECYETFCEMNVGKTILNEEEFIKIKEIQKSVFSNKIAFDLLQGCKIENSFYGEIDFEGEKIKIRMRPDAINVEQGYFISLKTTQDASADGFGNECAKWKYHAKESFYMHGLRYLLPDGQKPNTGYFIAVENQSPYLCQVFDMNEDREIVSEFFEVGKHLVDIAFSRYNDLIKTKVAKGYEYESNGIVQLKLPKYSVINSNNKLI